MGGRLNGTGESLSSARSRSQRPLVWMSALKFMPRPDLPVRTASENVAAAAAAPALCPQSTLSSCSEA